MSHYKGLGAFSSVNDVEKAKTIYQEGISRRDFLKYTSTTAGLVIMGIQLPCFAQSNTENELAFNLLTIHPDNSLTIYSSRSEMGQGVMTSTTQLLLDELDADWSQIREVKQGWADAEKFGHQNTIGAVSSLITWRSHRQAGGKINLLLRETAARFWGVELTAVKTHKGIVHNLSSSSRITYGDLIDKVLDKTLAKGVELKPAADFHLIGKSLPRLDAPEKVNGTAKFGIDQNLPNMKVAIVARSPVFGGKLKTFNADTALKIKGVHDVLVISSGVAIVADNFWLALNARKQLQIEWEHGSFAATSDTSLRKLFNKQLQGTGQTLTDIGNTDEQIANTPIEEQIQLNFNFPFEGHMTMEPMNCTAWFRGDDCEIWAPTQNPQDAQTAAAEKLGLDKERVRVNVTLMGGGFGRRAQEDFVLEACEIAKQVTCPIKVIWSREDDLRHDYYRPANSQKITATVKDGKIHSWQHKVATLSTSPYHFSLSDRNTDEGDWVAYGGSEASIYQIPNFQAQVSLTKTPMPVGILRGISHGYINFAVETTIDHLAYKLMVEPIAFRLKHLKEQRAVKVLRLLEEKLNTQKLTKNQFVGVAFGHEKAPEGPYQYYNAMAAIVEESKGRLKVDKIMMVLDHGQVINPDGLLAQAEGATVFAQSMMFHKGLTLQNGQIQQSNFHDYPVARMGEQIEIELFTVETHDWPMGVGEKLQGTIQPAIANALHRASGRRITSIPFDINNLGV